MGTGEGKHRGELGGDGICGGRIGRCAADAAVDPRGDGLGRQPMAGLPEACGSASRAESDVSVV